MEGKEWGATLPAPADIIVAEFKEKLLNIGTGIIEGIYLTGSLSLHDFYSHKSDIDFIVLCKSLPDFKTIDKIRKIHSTIARHHPKPDLSGSYIASRDIISDHPEAIQTLSYFKGQLRHREFDMAPISLVELKTNAITIYGQPAETLPILLSIEALNNFLFRNINSYWVNWIEDHSALHKRKVLLYLFPRLTEWAVLGVARQLCTLQTGKIVSKTEAGLYCLQHLPEQYHPILKEAIAIRKDNRFYPLVKTYAIRPDQRRMQQTLDGVRYIIAIFNQSHP
jgi:hypothetical protein